MTFVQMSASKKWTISSIGKSSQNFGTSLLDTSNLGMSYPNKGLQVWFLTHFVTNNRRTLFLQKSVCLQSQTAYPFLNFKIKRGFFFWFIKKQSPTKANRTFKTIYTLRR